MTSKIVTAQVECINYSYIHFKYSQFIRLLNLEFIGCGGNQVEHVQEFEVKDSKFRSPNTVGTALEIIETTTQIVNSIFKLNRKGKLKDNINVSIGKRFLCLDMVLLVVQLLLLVVR